MKPKIIILLLIVTLTSCNKLVGKATRYLGKEATGIIAKKTIKETEEEIANKGAEQFTKHLLHKSTNSKLKQTSEKILLRDGEKLQNSAAKRYVKTNMLNNGNKIILNDIPHGQKALDIVKRTDGGFEPSINNLNMKAQRYSNKVNRTLFAERRKAVTPSHQFPTLYQLTNKKFKQILGKKADANILRQNMYAAMDPKMTNISKAFGGNMAHHVVEGNDKTAEAARRILRKFKIDINDAANGILLPDGTQGSIYKGAIHKTSHTENYSKYVYSKIKDCKNREDVIAKLTDIKQEIYNGKINLQGIGQVYNKNVKLYE